MDLKFYSSASTVEPELIDDSSSKKVTYIRRNIVSEEQEDSNILYTYEECKLSKKDYETYINEELLKNSAESSEKVASLEDEITQLQIALCEVYELVATAAKLQI